MAMGVMSLGLLVYSCRFIYDAFVFSTEWIIFVVLMISLYSVVMLIINRVKDALILWSVIFTVHIVAQSAYCHMSGCYGDWGLLLHSARFLYDAFLFSVQWSIFLVIILAVYQLVLLILNHLHNAVIMWLLIFFLHLTLRIVYSHTTGFYYDWE